MAHNVTQNKCSALLCNIKNEECITWVFEWHFTYVKNNYLILQTLIQLKSRCASSRWPKKSITEQSHHQYLSLPFSPIVDIYSFIILLFGNTSSICHYRHWGITTIIHEYSQQCCQQYTKDLPKPISSSSESVSSFFSSSFFSSFLVSSAGAAPAPAAEAGAAAPLPTLLMRSLMLHALSARANSAAHQPYVIH